MIFQPISSGSSGNLYLVIDKGENGRKTLAIECGLPFTKLRRKLNHRLTVLDGVLISHCHGDHARSLTKVLAAGVDVYAPAHTLEVEKATDHHNAHVVEPLVPFIIKDHWQVLPFDLLHDVPAIGFLVKAREDKLLYVTDTTYPPYRFKGLNIIAIEANYSEAMLRNSNEGMKRKMRSLRYHISIERVLSFLAVNDLSSVREIHLLHLSDAHSDEQLFKSMVEAFTGKPVYVAKR